MHDSVRPAREHIITVELMKLERRQASERSARASRERAARRSVEASDPARHKRAA
jgi:hypothetical protein